MSNNTNETKITLNLYGIGTSQNCDVCLVASSCLSVRSHKKLGSHWIDFHDILYLSILRETFEKIHVPWKSHKNNGYFNEDLSSGYGIFLTSFLRKRNVWNKICSGNQNTSLLWDNVENYGAAVQTTADNIIRRTRLACSVTSATDTHSQYAMIIAICYMPALNVTLDLHCCRFKNSRFSKLIV